MIHFLGTCHLTGSSQVAGEKNLIEGEILGKRRMFALASGEEANNREKAHEVYTVHRTTSNNNITISCMIISEVSIWGPFLYT